jgi:hypothetical protein
MRLGLTFAAVLALLLPALGGCPANTCFLKVCTNGDCRCSISSCGDGAAFDTRQNRCRCLVGHIAVAGQCLTPAAANAYCGRGRHWEGAGCAPDRCKPGDEIDHATGWCIPHDQVNQVATNLGVSVGQGQKLGCPPGQELVIDGPRAACVPEAETCARDEAWNGKACVKTGQCPTGSSWDGVSGRCVEYAQGGSSELTVNVGQWAQSSYGPNGGPGTVGFCGEFAKKPWSFGVTEGATANVRVAIMMSFPEREIAKGVVQTVAVFDASGNPVPPKGGADVDAAARSIFAPLVQGGGRASAATAATTVRCAVVNAAKPLAVPATGGF